MKNLEEKIKVSIIEDDLMIQDMYRIELEKEGFLVSCAKDGEEGFSLMKKEIPDVAIIDILMPKVNGIELIKKINDDPDLLKIPVIIASNENNERITKEAGNLNVKFFLVKTLFTPKDVVNIVREVLESRR